MELLDEDFNRKFVEAEKTLEPTAYQKALLFKLRFQKSKLCKNFRKEWSIPQNGFKDNKGYQKWYSDLIAKTNKYYKSKKCQESRNILKQKRKDRSSGKISDAEFIRYVFIEDYKVPSYRYEVQLSRTVVQAGKPMYWKYFIEQCLLFNNYDVLPITRPVPKPNLEWNPYVGAYYMTIDNIFSDTTIEDFRNKSFTEEFKKLQKKMPGYEDKKPRLKPKLEYAIAISEIAAGADFEDYEGKGIEEKDVFSREKRTQNSNKQTVHRLKKYLEQPVILSKRR